MKLPLLTFEIDDVLLQSFVKGDLRAFRNIVDDLLPSIHAAAISYFRSEALAKEFSVDVLTRVWQDRSCYRDAGHFNSCLVVLLKELAHPYFLKALKEQIALSEQQEAVSEDPEREGCISHESQGR